MVDLLDRQRPSFQETYEEGEYEGETGLSISIVSSNASRRHRAHTRKKERQEYRHPEISPQKRGPSVYTKDFALGKRGWRASFVLASQK